MEYSWNTDWQMPTATFSRNGKLVAMSSDSHVHVWYTNGRAAGELASGRFSNEAVICLALSAHGQRVASGSIAHVECEACG